MKRPSKPIDVLQDVVIETDIGNIFIKVYVNRAPITAKNFLALVDIKAYAGGSFYRSVKSEHLMAGDMELVQGGILPRQSPFPSIEHETTVETGMAHDIGVVSMARRSPGTASTEFFVCLAKMPILDYSGGLSNGNFDGHGYASFARVVAGLDVIQKIQAMPTGVEHHDLGSDVDTEEFEKFKPQLLKKKVSILDIRRVQS